MKLRSLLRSLVAHVTPRRRGSGDKEDPVERYWTRAFDRGGMTTWMSEERCREYINESVTGSLHEWPMEWFQRVFVVDRLDRGLSLGCGDGALERDVRRKGICREIVGIDLSAGALERAAAQAGAEGLDGIEYQRGDFNRLELPEDRFDIVFFHQAMHHVENLEGCIEKIRHTLRPGGLFYLDEYVGPSRTEWTEALIAEANRLYCDLPKRIRTSASVPLPIEQDDPSEAVRSSEIVGLVSAPFELLARRDYGGNVLSLLHPLIRWPALEPAERSHLLDHLIDSELRLLRAGSAAFYTVMVMRNS